MNCRPEPSAFVRPDPSALVRRDRERLILKSLIDSRKGDGHEAEFVDDLDSPAEVASRRACKVAFCMNR